MGLIEGTAVVVITVTAVIFAVLYWLNRRRIDKYRNLFLVAPNPIFILNKETEIIDCNEETEAVFGCSREEITGRSFVEFSQVVQADGQNSETKLKNLLEEVESGDSHHFEWTNKRADEIPFPAEISLTNLPLPAGQYYLAIVRDVHGRKQLEEELRLTRHRLQKANQRLEEQAIFDSLTGVMNRRGFDQALEEEWNRCRRKHAPLSLLIIDIDHFKLYNDNYGHTRGDECLKEVAEIISANARRAADTAARYGGEEFAAILPTTPASGARQVAENIREAVREARMEHESSPVDEYLTVSIGTHTMVPDGQKDSEDLVEAADRALYQAKNGGRDRVEVA